MRRLSILSACLLAFAAVPAQASALPHYKISLLNGIAGGGATYATGVNSSGQVVGVAQDADSVYRAVSWDSSGALSIISPGNGAAYAINDAGTIAGEVDEINGTLWSGGVSQPVGPLNAILFTSISQNGHAAGQNIGADLYGIYNHAVYYADGVAHDIGAFGDGYAVAEGINDSDQVVGYGMYSRTGQIPHAFYYSGGVMTDIGTFGGDESEAYGINNSGLAVGTAQASNGNFLGFTYANGVMTSLGGFGSGDDVSSAAYAINDAGQIVGTVWAPDAGDWHAALWQGGQLYDLNTLLGSGGAGWQLEVGGALSSNGLIVGYGYLNGVRSNFLLQAAPAPEPASWALMLAGFGAIGGAMRRRPTRAVA